MAPLTKIFHITSKDHGSTTVWYPRICGLNRPGTEPKIPRICFSKKITGCFISLGYILRYYPNWFLYSANVDEYYAPSAKEVTDCKATQEVWRMSRTKIDRLYKFSKEEIESISQHLTFVSGHPSVVKFGQKYSQKIDYELNKFKIYEKVLKHK
jgi:hypothetical protein